MLMVGRVKSADSCLHGKGQGHNVTYREKKEAAKMLEINKERNERIKILEVCYFFIFNSSVNVYLYGSTKLL